MKKVRLLLLCAFCFSYFLANAQVKQPSTAGKPSVAAENCKIRYYYYPNLLAYYDIQKEIFYLRKDGKWFTAPEIPSGFAGYSVYNQINVPIEDYDDDNITQFLDQHKKQFPYVSPAKARNLTASVR